MENELLVKIYFGRISEDECSRLLNLLIVIGGWRDYNPEGSPKEEMKEIACSILYNRGLLVQELEKQHFNVKHILEATRSISDN